MAVYFQSSDPQRLLDDFNQAINEHHVGSWRTALYNEDFGYTHTSFEWKERGWLQSSVEDNRLAFYIKSFDFQMLKREVYDYYSAHLIETFERHFPAEFSGARATPNPDGADDAFV